MVPAVLIIILLGRTWSKPEDKQAAVTSAATATEQPSLTPAPTDIPNPTATAEMVMEAPTEAPTQTPTPAPTHTPEPLPTPTQSVVLFEDSFDNGLKPQWVVASGKPLLVNEGLSAKEETWLYVGDEEWTDYSVSLRSSPQGEWGVGYAYLAVRASGSNMMVFAWSQNNSRWYEVRNGNWEQVSEPVFHSPMGSNLVTVMVTVEGSKLAGYLNGQKVTSYVTDDFPAGSLGLQLGVNSTADDFLVRSLVK